MNVPDNVRRLARDYLSLSPTDPRTEQALKTLEHACKDAGIELRQAYEAALKNTSSKPTPPPFTPTPPSPRAVDGSDERFERELAEVRKAALHASPGVTLNDLVAALNELRQGHLEGAEQLPARKLAALALRMASEAPIKS